MSNTQQVCRPADMGWRWKERLPRAILAALAVPFTLFYGVFEIYAGNKDEFDFAFGDFALWVSLLCGVLFLILFAVLILLRGRAFRVAFAFLWGFSVLAYVQGNFLNIGVHSLVADGVGMAVNPVWEVCNGILWVLAITGCIVAVCFVREKSAREWMDTVSLILLVMILGMQAVSLAVNGVTMDVFEPKTVSSPDGGESVGGQDGARYVLTEKNLFEVSSGDNILVFVLDRFDMDYMNGVVEDDPDFFDKLDGFTCYHDNMSLFTRTYPAAASMITGIENDFSGSADDYFETAYQTSPFLQDLKANNYQINLYVDEFYSYRDARELLNVADNVDVADGYRVQYADRLALHLIGLAAYRYAPIPLKRVFDLSTESFKGFVQYDGENDSFLPNDAALYERLEQNGLTVQDEQNTYMFIHLWGCHPPYRIDENGTPTTAGTAEGATKGCFNMIYMYIDELKRLGLYEDATIVITGDHPDPLKDYEDVPKPRLTALFVKPSGSSGTPLAHSEDAVSQSLLIPSLVQSAELVTERDYGPTYWDGPQALRRYLFIKNVEPDRYHIVEYSVTGDGRHFDNWCKLGEKDVGFLYK